MSGEFILIVSVFLFMLMVISFGLLLHDDPIVRDAYEKASINYFVESNDDMTNAEKYTLMDTTCLKYASGDALNDKLWFESDSDEQPRLYRCKQRLLQFNGLI